MVKLDTFLERGAAVRGLCESFMAGAPVHAVLITGPSGVGKRTLSALCAQALHCKGEARPCGSCPACARVLAGSHPDAHHIPEQRKIGVEEIRALIGKLSVSAYEGGFKTVCIDCAGSMTVQAQNCLLKTLEEPPPGTVFLLTAISGRELLQTVVSRCRVTPLFPMSPQALFEALRALGASEDKASRLMNTNGSIGEALTMLNDTAYWALSERVIQAMLGIQQPVDAFVAIQALSDKENAKHVCDILEREIREALHCKVNRLDADGWVGALQKRSANSIVGLLEKVFSLRMMLSSNVPWQSALERFVLDYSEE